MKRLKCRLVAVAQVVLLSTVVAWPQASLAEEWGGTLKRKGKQKQNITLVVKHADDGPVIRKMIYAGTSFEIKQQKFTDSGLDFTWAPGDRDVTCRLKMKKGDRYVGECQAEDAGSVIKMKILARDEDDKPDEDAEEESGKNKKDPDDG